jgi:hypothetical protein
LCFALLVISSAEFCSAIEVSSHAKIYWAIVVLSYAEFCIAI